MEFSPLHIGIAAGICTAISMIPQLIKILKEKKSEQVSVPMILILLSGLALWVWYGFVKKDFPVIITNCFSLLVNILLAIFSIRYKKKKTAQ
ncbi:SemiSWEET transporter [Agriterribacter humi]|jgi:MtN3 and saliva related transmembrane protein|uniref:SemiSWEET transporter n=1 Tax=Agriterribacter humi TaxID=1104781 RepID=UPI00126524EE|nr:SemiSWEET transporter [Agriterribacter humi]